MKKKQKDKLFENLPACAADFIKLVIKKMRYRKKVRANVQAELTAHFEDELKDYKNNEEKTQKAQKMITDFGDVKLLAVLLRRAKKRCRPLWRTIVARTFQTIGVLIVCFILYAVWFLIGKPIITTNYVEVMNETAKPFADVDPNLNARTYYYKAAEVLEQKKEEDRHYSDVVHIKSSEATSEDKEKIEQWLKDNKELLDMIAAGSRLPYYWPEYKTGEEENSTEAIAILMPHLASYRTFVKAICWRAGLKAEKGDFEGVFDDLLTCYRVGRHLKGDMTLGEQLVGIAIEALATEGIKKVLSLYEIDPALLAKLQNDFENLVANEDFVISFDQEKFFFYDEVQRSFTVDRIGGGHLYLKRVGHIGALMGPSFRQNKLKFLLYLLFLHPDKQATLDAVNKFYNNLEQLALMSPAKQKAENIDIEKQLEQYCKGSLFLELLVPEFSHVIQLIQLGYRNKAQIQATPLIIAIHRYEQDFGNLPDNLDAIEKSGYIKKLPIDPFSDKPLVYKKTNDGFTVYSVGLNFIDDGGKVYRDEDGSVRLWDRDEGDAVFWPVMGK